MGRGYLGRSALLRCVALASVVGCGGSQGSSLVPQSGAITVNPKWKAPKRPKPGGTVNLVDSCRIVFNKRRFIDRCNRRLRDRQDRDQVSQRRDSLGARESAAWPRYCDS